MHSRLQPWLECYVWNWSIPLVNWEAVTADLKSCGGKIHLMQHWMAGHTTTKALSHSYEAYLIAVPQRAICLCLSLHFFSLRRYSCLYRSVSLWLQTAHSPSFSLQPLVLLCECTVQRADMLHDSIKWIISQHLWPSTGLSLAANQERNSEETMTGQTSFKIGRIDL